MFYNQKNTMPQIKNWLSQTAEDRNNELEDSATENIQTEAQMEKEKWKKEKRS